MSAGERSAVIDHPQWISPPARSATGWPFGPCPATAELRPSFGPSERGSTGDRSSVGWRRDRSLTGQRRARFGPADGRPNSAGQLHARQLAAGQLAVSRRCPAIRVNNARATVASATDRAVANTPGSAIPANRATLAGTTWATVAGTTHRAVARIAAGRTVARANAR